MQAKEIVLTRELYDLIPPPPENPDDAPSVPPDRSELAWNRRWTHTQYRTDPTAEQEHLVTVVWPDTQLLGGVPDQGRLSDRRPRQCPASARRLVGGRAGADGVRGSARRGPPTLDPSGTAAGRLRAHQSGRTQGRGRQANPGKGVPKFSALNQPFRQRLSPTDSLSLLPPNSFTDLYRFIPNYRSLPLFTASHPPHRLSLTVIHDKLLPLGVAHWHKVMQASV
ncbi:hypothetical protein MycrhDRAFT_6976 [Mycolicibacterium rhodesiae JS60]|nr:hypothetical protein MycrhDRAFT_6976 [Mycolicibacterium rhodesiae JS60]